MEKINKHVGLKLRKIRLERDLTQIEMADMLKIQDKKYSRIERGNQSVDIKEVAEFAEKLKVPITDLLPQTNCSVHIDTNNDGLSINGDIYNNKPIPESYKELKIVIQQLQTLCEALSKVTCLFSNQQTN